MNYQYDNMYRVLEYLVSIHVHADRACRLQQTMKLHAQDIKSFLL